MRTAKIKKLLIEELKQKPVIETACRAAGIGRTAFYDWKKKDPKFAEAVTLALQFGKAFMADIAEMQLFNAIKNSDFRAVALYLRTHHSDYGNKLEVDGVIKTMIELSPEDEAQRRRVIRLGRFTPIKNDSDNKH